MLPDLIILVVLAAAFAWVNPGLVARVKAVRPDWKGLASHRYYRLGLVLFALLVLAWSSLLVEQGPGQVFQSMSTRDSGREACFKLQRRIRGRYASQARCPSGGRMLENAHCLMHGSAPQTSEPQR